MKHELPKLEYAYDALEPYIDAQTMEIHHSKHHQAYTDKFNAALEKYPELAEKTAEEILSNLNAIPEDIRMAVRNNGGGYYNHNFFWTILKKDVALVGKLADAIKSKWGSYDKFKEEFSNAAATRFGSGWAWLVTDSSGQLSVVSTQNQDTPISEGKIPIICLDVWEHAYYLKYQNKRPDYIQAFFRIIDWEQADKYYTAALNPNK